MTNKLPIVGETYKNKTNKMSYVCIAWDGIKTWKFLEVNDWYINPLNVAQDNIFNIFEELPNQPTSAKSAQVGSEKVEEAFKSLRSYLNRYDSAFVATTGDSKKYGQSCYYRSLESLAQNLIDALEEQKEETKLECATPEEEPTISKKEIIESIWKPTSELLLENKGYYDNLNYQNFTAETVNYFGAILKQQESLAKNQEIIFAEIEKLKNK